MPYALIGRISLTSSAVALGHLADDRQASEVATDQGADNERYALLVVDMQNGFCHPDGSFPR
ncbi:MAG: hypothetical protein ACRDNW_17725, partial [Trebonia sp.]